MPALADLNGDGRADLVSLWPVGDGVIDWIPTSQLGKPRTGVALPNFGRDGLAVTCGRFTKSTGAEVLALFADGSIRLASDCQEAPARIGRQAQVATIPTADFPQAPITLTPADFNGDGLTDVLVSGSSGKTFLLQNRSTGTDPRFMVRALATPLPPHNELVAGRVGTDARARLLWLDTKGNLFRSVLQSETAPSTAPPRLTPPVTVLKNLPSGTRIAVGFFRGDQKSADLIVGQSLYPGGEISKQMTLPELPTIEQSQADRIWMVGDLDGNGKDELVRSRITGARRFNEDVFVHYFYDPATEPGKGFYSSANDGLPDFWKLGRVKPGGLDLAAMGCQVGRRDLILEVQPLADVDPQRLAADMDRVQKFYANIPVQNPDGSRGIAVHVVYRDPIPTTLRDSRQWADFSDMWRILWPQNILPEHQGITHYIGVSNEAVGFTENGRSWANCSWPVLLHELGHQLWLNHNGGWRQEFNAAYPSLMNYAYSYGLYGDVEKINYSDGSLTALGPLNEEHLNEILAVPYEKAAFLAGAPYHFTVKAGDTPNTTLVDWNWNGILGEKDVRADLNYHIKLDMDPCVELGPTWTAPQLTTIDAGTGPERLLLFTGTLPENTPRPPAEATATAPSLSPELPGGIAVTVWTGTDRDRDRNQWSAPISIRDSGVTGDFSVATLPSGGTWVAYPTKQGVFLRHLTIATDGTPSTSGSPIRVPGTIGTSPTVAALGNRLVLVLWLNEKEKPVYRFLTPNGDDLKISDEKTLPFSSRVPIALAPGLATPDSLSLWMTRMLLETGPPRLRNLNALRFTISGNQRDTLKLAEEKPVGGVYSLYRPTLIWESVPGLNGQGRLFILSGGAVHPELPYAPQFLTMQTAGNKDWVSPRYYEEDFASRSAPAACWFQNNLAYASRLFKKDTRRNDGIVFSFRATGATPTPLGDFNDIAHLTEFGLSRSLTFLVR